jgi:hypothetical protein
MEIKDSEKLVRIEKLLEDGEVEEALEAAMELEARTRDLALLMLVEWGYNCAEDIENEYYRNVAMAILYERGETGENDVKDVRIKSAAMKRVAVRDCDVSVAARIPVPYYRALAFMEISKRTGKDFGKQIESAINMVENPYLRKWIERRFKGRL